MSHANAILQHTMVTIDFIMGSNRVRTIPGIGRLIPSNDSDVMT
jgi:hypothetical protein